MSLRGCGLNLGGGQCCRLTGKLKTAGFLNHWAQFLRVLIKFLSVILSFYLRAPLKAVTVLVLAGTAQLSAVRSVYCLSADVTPPEKVCHVSRFSFCAPHFGVMRALSVYLHKNKNRQDLESLHGKGAAIAAVLAEIQSVPCMDFQIHHNCKRNSPCFYRMLAGLAFYYSAPRMAQMVFCETAIAPLF